MDKILFYVSDYEEAKLVFPYVEKLYSAGYEVAFDAPHWEVVELLTYTHLLVVKYNVYEADVYVSNTQLDGVTVISISDFMEAFL